MRSPDDLQGYLSFAGGLPSVASTSAAMSTAVVYRVGPREPHTGYHLDANASAAALHPIMTQSTLWAPPAPHEAGVPGYITLGIEVAVVGLAVTAWRVSRGHVVFRRLGVRPRAP